MSSTKHRRSPAEVTLVWYAEALAKQPDAFDGTPRDEISHIIFILDGDSGRRLATWMYVRKQGVSDGHASAALPRSGMIPTPHVVIPTGTLRGRGAGSIYTSGQYLPEILADGEVVLGNERVLRRVRKQLGF